MQEKTLQNAIIILDRLKLALDVGTDAALAELIGIKQPTISSWRSRDTMDYPAIIAICNNAGLDLNYIFTGEGEKSTPNNTPIGTPNGKTEVKYAADTVVSVFNEPGPPKVITVTENNEDAISIVQVKAAAGYLNGYADQEFIESLPTLAVPGLKGGTHRAFEVKGASMLPTHHPGSISICRYVESFSEIRDRRVYVLVTRDGVVLKRVLNRVEEEGKLILISDNENKREYPNYPIYAEDVLEIWYWRASIIRESPEPGGMYNRLNDLQADVTLMRAELSQLKGSNKRRLNDK